MRRGRAGAAKPYGSIYKWNSARNAFELRQRAEPDLHGAHLTLKHRKSNLGPRLGDLNLILRWNDKGATFNPEVFTEAVRPPLALQILDVLATGPATAGRLADLLSDEDVTYHEIDVRREIKGLLTGKKISTGTDGTLRIAQPVDNVLDSPLPPD
jgi:hypothetical protein